MRVTAERAGPVVVVHLEGGRLVVEVDTQPLHDLVRRVTHVDGAWSVVLDLAKVWQLDCSGIGQIVELNNEVRESGGVFALVNVAPRPKSLLAVLGLLRVFPVFASEEDAITACWSARARGRARRPPRADPCLLAAPPRIGVVLQPVV